MAISEKGVFGDVSSLQTVQIPPCPFRDYGGAQEINSETISKRKRGIAGDISTRFCKTNG
jgi:hypothetical protein